METKKETISIQECKHLQHYFIGQIKNQMKLLEQERDSLDSDTEDYRERVSEIVTSLNKFNDMLNILEQTIKNLDLLVNYKVEEALKKILSKLDESMSTYPKQKEEKKSE